MYSIKDIEEPIFRPESVSVIEKVMPVYTIEELEYQIFCIEKVIVNFRHPNGRKVRSTRAVVGAPQYYFKRAAPGNWNATDLILNRLKRLYRGFEFSIHYPCGKRAHGKKKLKNLRHG